MDLIDVIAILISIIFFIIYLPGVLFLIGKGGIAVAGYHFEAKNDKAKVYHKYIMRRLGVWYLVLIAVLHACILCGMHKKMTACYVLLGLFIVHSVLGLVWFNTNKKIKHARDMEKKLNENPNLEEKTEN